MSAAQDTILVVDDEAILRMCLVETLEDRGFRVVEAADAHQALKVLQAEAHIRIVITDIQMPGSIDGLRLAAHIHLTWPPIALIIASGAVRPIADELPAGAIFMQKPIDTNDLVRRVENLMAAGS